MTRAHGHDFSHWQTDATFADAIKGDDFVYVKACEGGSTDPEFNDSDDHRWTTLGAKVSSGDIAFRGAYVFLTLGRAASAQQADLQRIAGRATLSSRHIFDWESSALSEPDLLGWAVKHDWDANKIAAGVYCSDANVSVAESALSARGLKRGTHYFIIIARYGAEPSHAWDFWQDVGVGIDHDVYKDDRAALNAWAGAKEDDDVALTKDQEATLTKMAGEQHGEQDAWDGKNNPTPLPGEKDVGPFVYIGFNRVRAMLGKPLVGVK